MKVRMVKCSDVGIGNCSYMAMGYDLEEVEQKMFDHVDTEHKDLLETMSHEEAHELKHRISAFLGRSCGCGHLPKP
jgi:predicted small metal-binding protein